MNAEIETKQEESLAITLRSQMKAESSRSELAFLNSESMQSDTGVQEIDTKIEIKDKPLWLERTSSPQVKSESILNSEVVFLNSDVIVESDSWAHEMDPKMEIKEELELWCPETSHVKTEAEDMDLQADTSVTDDREQEPHLTEPTRLCVEDGPCGEHAADTGNITHASGNKSVTQILDDSQTPQNCKIRGKTISTAECVNKHNLSHEGRTPYKCNICGKSFSRSSNLKRHNLYHEGKRSFNCKVCGKSFFTAPDVKRHSLSHVFEGPYVCKVCGKGFNRLAHLQRHKLTHEGTRPYKCKICEKSFTEEYYLNMHNKHHEGKKSHKCKICEKSFIMASDLKRHHLIHEGRRPFNCNLCEKSFIRVSNLKSHNLTHEEKT